MQPLARCGVFETGRQLVTRAGYVSNNSLGSHLS